MEIAALGQGRGRKREGQGRGSLKSSFSRESPSIRSCGRPCSPIQSLRMAALLQRESDTVAKVILGLSKTLASTLELDEVLVRILDSIGARHSRRFLLPPPPQRQEPRGQGRHRLRGSGSHARHAHGPGAATRSTASSCESGTPMVIDDVSPGPALEPPAPAPQPIRSWMGIPLRASGEVIGMLAIDSRTAGAYTEEEREVADAFADLAAAAVRNARTLRDRQAQDRGARRRQQDRRGRRLAPRGGQALRGRGAEPRARYSRRASSTWRSGRRRRGSSACPSTPTTASG